MLRAGMIGYPYRLHRISRAWARRGLSRTSCCPEPLYCYVPRVELEGIYEAFGVELD